MSKRNSWAAKTAAKKAGRSSYQNRIGDIADAVHDAVCVATRSDGMGHCVEYAATAAFVLTRLSGRRWDVQAGSAYYGTVNKEYDFAWQSTATTPGVFADGTVAHSGGLNHGELHAWAAWTADGEYPAGVADFAARHVHACSLLLGDPELRVDPIPYAYGSPAELGARRIKHDPDEATTRFVEAHVVASLSAYRDMATLALHKLGEMSAAEARHNLSNPALIGPLEALGDGWRVADASTGSAIMVRP